jgi:Secretion system C-terminal sorting domain
MNVPIKRILGIVLIFLSCNAWTQISVTYDYDATGNRIDSRVVLLKMGHIASENDSVQSNSQAIKDTIKAVQKDQLDQKSISIYPNPTTGAINIDVQGNSDQTPTIFTLYDLSGKVLQQQVIQSNQLVLDLSSYTKGIYILKIQSGPETRDWKIIKE